MIKRGRPTKTDSILRNLKKQTYAPSTPITKPQELHLPNFSGDHSAGIVNTTPTKDTDIANKKYVDDNAGGTPEGTAILSTGENNTKYLRADGDNTCSWQTPTSGDVTAAANIAAEALVVGDDGAKGVKTLVLGTTALQVINLKPVVNGDVNKLDVFSKSGGAAFDATGYLTVSIPDGNGYTSRTRN